MRPSTRCPKNSDGWANVRLRVFVQHGKEVSAQTTEETTV